MMDEEPLASHGLEKKSFVERDDGTLETGAATAIVDGTAVHGLATRGHLIAASITLGANSPAIWAVVSAGTGLTAHVLDAGWTRGPSVFSQGPGIDWDGRIALERDEMDTLYAFLRNDSGSTVTFAVEWTTERD